MFLVAITGGIATGKSTASQVFERQGIPIIDARKIAKEIVEPGKPCWKKIRILLGDEVLLPTQELNRNVLGQLIGDNQDTRRKLNEIIYPAIQRVIVWRVFKYLLCGRAYVVLDLPLLFEMDILTNYMHKIITVSCDPDKQLERLLERNELSVEEAKERVESQMPMEIKCERSHFVIDNNGSIEETEAETMRIYHLMQKSKKHLYNRFIFLTALLFVCSTMYFFLFVMF
ncbi:hypothetical protein ACLKA6_017065 [Drosophila palustris]